MSNLVTSLSRTHAPLSVDGEKARNTTPGDSTLATIILGSTAESQPSSLLARDVEQILSPTIMSIVLSHFRPEQFHEMASCLAQPNLKNKVMQDACIAQIQSHNSTNTPMKYKNVFLLAQMIQGPIPHILQLNLSETNAKIALS